MCGVFTRDADKVSGDGVSGQCLEPEGGVGCDVRHGDEFPVVVFDVWGSVDCGEAWVPDGVTDLCESARFECNTGCRFVQSELFGVYFVAFPVLFAFSGCGDWCKVWQCDDSFATSGPLYCSGGDDFFDVGVSCEGACVIEATILDQGDDVVDGAGWVEVFHGPSLRSCSAYRQRRRSSAVTTMDSVTRTTMRVCEWSGGLL